jgi:excisionase family DNA binding protein
MSDEPTTISVTEAARRLSVSGQAVRNWLRSGKLSGDMGRARWRVDVASVDAIAPAPDETDADEVGLQPGPAGIEDRVDRLAAAVERLVERDDASAKLVGALQRERDHFRAEAATAKEVALRVTMAARETDKAVRQLLDVLAIQADALAQLLAPSSPEGLVRDQD